MFFGILFHNTQKVKVGMTLQKKKLERVKSQGLAN